MEDPNPVENIDRLGDLMFQTSDKSQLLRRVLWINAQLTIVWSLKHKISQPIYIFSRENSQNSESSNGPRRGLDFIDLSTSPIVLIRSGDPVTYWYICHSFFLLHLDFPMFGPLSEIERIKMDSSDFTNSCEWLSSCCSSDVMYISRW